MPQARPADRAPRGGPVNIWLPGPLKAELQRLKDERKISWSQLLEHLLRGKVKK